MANLQTYTLRARRVPHWAQREGIPEAGREDAWPQRFRVSVRKRERRKSAVAREQGRVDGRAASPGPVGGRGLILVPVEVTGRFPVRTGSLHVDSGLARPGLELPWDRQAAANQRDSHGRDQNECAPRR